MAARLLRAPRILMDKVGRRVLRGLTDRPRSVDVAFLYQFHRGPYGGGNQFLRALWDEFRCRGLRLGNDSSSATAKACLFNSFNVARDSLARDRGFDCRMVHRVDGPIDIYRGFDKGVDKSIADMNHEYADATIFQSEYSRRAHAELGLEFKEPHVILNAADPALFNAHGRIQFNRRRKTRIISTSWSDNMNKGASVYEWLDHHLDWSRFEYTFVGRSPVRFQRIKMVAPQPTREVANLLRQHDIYITASRFDSCSNSLIEAITCGLPAIYLDSGGNPEIVRSGGLPFLHKEEVPVLLDDLVDGYEEFEQRITAPSLPEVADRYLRVLGIERSQA